VTASETDFVLAQYETLRAEILLLIETQSQLVGVNVVAFGALLSVAVQGEHASVVLVYPIVSLILGISWLNHAYAICRTSEFIARHIEPNHFQADLGWETYLRTLEPTAINKIGYWGVRAVFAGGSVLSLLVSLLIGVHGETQWIAFWVSSAIVVGTIVLFAFMREPSHEISNPNSGSA